MSDYFDEYSFKSRMEKAIETAQLVLAANRTLSLPEDSPHIYDDKYVLANTCTTTLIAAFLQILDELGCDANVVATLLGWAETGAVSLRLESNEKFKFVNETVKSVEDPHSVVHTNTLGLKSSIKTYTKITEYNFQFDVAYTLVAFRGVGAEDADRVTILSRTATQMLVLRSKEAIYPASDTHVYDVNISALLRYVANVESGLEARFEINRSREGCHTPRRNEDVEAVLLGQLTSLHSWTEEAVAYFLDFLFPVQTTYAVNRVQPNLDLMSAEEVFSPVVPLFEQSSAIGAEDGSVLPVATVAQLLGEHRRSLKARREQLASNFPAPAADVLVTAAEATLVLCLSALLSLCAHYYDAVNYIESLIRKQLVAAVGKVLQPADFDAYMQFHYRRLLREEFQPRPFLQAVRRSLSHSPEGAVRIEESVAGKAAQPILTFTRSEPAAAAAPMEFNLSASSKVTFGGERHLHLYLGHSFSGEPLASLTFVAEARQFSSFILLVGRIASAREFDPKYAIIVQNKDQIKIPLSLEQIPTAKEFRNAIESLSPEQQRFASAIRSMQLGGTVFGILAIQIKPHLERLLNLCPDSLTKEIALGQDLMDMFIKYQIPSDLVSFEGGEGAAASVRVEQVRGHVGAIKDMIRAAKEEEVREKELADKAIHGVPVPVPYPPGMPLNMPMPTSSAMYERSMAPMAKRGGAPRMLSSVHPSAVNTVSRSSLMDMPESASFVSAGGGSGSGPPLREMKEEARFEVNAILDETPAPDTGAGGGGGKGGARDVSLPQQDRDSLGGVSGDHRSRTDYTAIPAQLDSAHDRLDPDSALRSTIINPGEAWTRRRQKGLMREPTTSTLATSDLETERSAAFDLLDALSRSGARVLEDAALHVVVASTHNFDKSLMDTVVQGNVNPVERAERSSLVMVTTLHGLPAERLLKLDHVARVQTYSPALFITQNQSSSVTAPTSHLIE